MKKILLFVFLLAGTALAAQKAQPIRVLFIGNSYTFYHNLPDLVSQIGESVGFPIDATACTKGSQRFTGHLQNGKLLRMLAAGGWDYVVLQEQSEAPALPTELVAEGTYRPARTLDSLVHAGSPQARVIYYMTWGRKEGSKTYGNHYPPVATYEGMQQRLATSYLEMAYRSGGWCAPVHFSRRYHH